jgi:competence protein ComEA
MSSSFHLTQYEKRAILGALFFMVTIVAVKIYDNNLNQSYIVKAQLDILMKKDSLVSVSPTVVKFDFPKVQSKKRLELKLIPERINPNLAEVDDWIRIGFSNKISERIYKFIKLKGGIKKSSDLLSVYGLRQEWLSQIQDSLEFIIPKIDIQFANENSLVSVKGIGEIYAKRIIKYRQKLGGYTSISQLNEVYGIDSVLLLSISDRIICSPNDIILLNINSIGYNELYKHPYISKKEAMAIILARSEKGKLNIGDIQIIFPENKLVKIKKYLKW